MQIPDSKLALRFRLNFEAIDAGCLLARRYWPTLLAGWLIISLPAFIALWFLDNLFWTIVLLWWMKPLYERIPLQLIASKMFDQRANLLIVIKTVFSVDTIWWLTLFRFFPGRSTLTPIAALEGLPQGSRKISERRRLISTRALSSYFVLHWIMFLMEIMCTVSALSVIYLIWQAIAPGDAGDFLAILDNIWKIFGSPTGTNLIVTVYFVSMAVIAPFYVCSGFTIYLNRRIELEGWDIELMFRRIGARVVSVFLLVGFLVFPCFEAAVGQELNEGESIQTINERMQIQEATRRIYEEQEIFSDEIRRESVRKTNRRISTTNRRDNPLVGLLGFVIQVLIWVVVIGVVVWLITRFKVWTLFNRRSTKKTVSSDKEIVEDFTAQLDLPEDIVGSSRTAWETGNPRAALSLLYRGSLFQLVIQHECPINLSHTETACTRFVERTIPRLSGAFQAITQAWQQVAYTKMQLNSLDYENTVRLYEEAFS